MADSLPVIVPGDGLVQTSDRPSSLLARGLMDVGWVLSQQGTDAEGLFQRGMAHLDKGEPDASCEFFLAAAKLGHAEAQLLTHELSYNSSRDHFSDANQQAMHWLEESVSTGFGPAQRYLAIEFQGGDEGWPRRRLLLEQATEWYELRAAAGDLDAQKALAMMHWKEEAPHATRAKAFHWMTAAAEQDNPHAMVTLGYWYLRDDPTKQGADQSIYWYSKAAQLGDSWACQELGDLFLFGHGGSRSDVRAGRAPTQIFPPNPIEAVSWYTRRFELGSALGAYTLGELYLEGVYIGQNLRVAEQWLLTAAKAGSTDAERLLGCEYATGERFERNLGAAIVYLTPSAERGFVAIQYRLAKVYEDREAEKREARDYTLAYKWYYLTAQTDKKVYAPIRNKAAAVLSALSTKMEPGQCAEAQRLAREWTNDHAP